jgi:PKD repeat protein
LYTSTGTLILAKTIFVPDGQSRVTLDFDIPTAGNYQLGVTAGSNLYRNNAGASYPYTIPGLLSITSSNSTSNQLTYYYYCYDWEVQELPCASSYTTVNLTVTNPIASYAFSSTGLTVTFTDNSIGNVISYTWTFGDGQTANVASPVHTFAADGTYTVNLHIETSDGCTSDFSQVITISANGIAEVLAEAIDISSKNDQLTVKFDHVAKDAQIRITDMLGQVLFSTSFSKGNVFTHTMNEIAGSYVLVNVIEGDRTTTKKVFMTK